MSESSPDVPMVRLHEQTGLEPLDRSPIEWVKNHHTQIRKILEDVRQELAHSRPSLLNPYNETNLSPEVSTLSEMCLCVAWEDIEKECGLPEGFTFIDEGAVQLQRKPIPSITGLSSSEAPWMHHIFLQKIEPNGEREIICLTGAQFIPRKRYVVETDEKGREHVVPVDPHRGDKMSTLMDLAERNGRPDLYTRLDEDLAIIYGRASEIKQFLGLDYSPIRPS